MSRLISSILLCVSLLIMSASTTAQEWRSEPSSPLDQQYRKQQIASLNELSGLRLGRSLQGDRANDLNVLQQLLDQRIVKSDQVVQLQAMGIVLGELLKQEKGLLWVTYIDKLGQSRALTVPGRNEFIFPVTQISRRAEVGIKVNVKAVYQELVDAVDRIRGQQPSLR